MRSEMLLILIFLSNVIFCEALTCVVVLHGRGESIPDGLAHGFANKLRSVLSDKNMTDYEVMEVGLSRDSDEDYDWSSFKPMDFQLAKLCQYIDETVLDRLKEDCHRIQLVGCSQGALLMRGLLRGQCLDSVVPKIDKLITFGGPNNGIFGIPSCGQLAIDNSLLMFGCRILEDSLNNSNLGPSLFDPFMFSSEEVLSFASYWNSPANLLSRTTFLAYINNEDINKTKPKYLSQKIKSLVMISFGNESTVLPQISASFGYWDRKAKNLILYNETDLYKNDLFGLKTLDRNNGLVFKTIANSSHMNIPLEFVKNEFINYIR